MKQSVLIVASAATGLLTGFVLRAARQPGEPPATSMPAGKSTPRDAAGPAGVAAMDSPALQEGSALAAKLRTDLSMSDGVTRWLHWMTAVEKATPKDFPHLARLAKDIPGAVAILGARWIEIDPQGLFEACMDGNTGGPGFPSDELGTMLFQTWPQKDPDAALAVLKANPSIQMGWQYQALETLFSNRPEEALITMSELRIGSFSPGMHGVEKWAAADPRRAAEVALAHPCGFASRAVLAAIGKQWAASDPQGALAFAASQATASGRELANQLIKNWVEKDPAKASEWFEAADDATNKRLLPSFVEAWGKQDAHAALQWCQTNTSGARQADLIASLVKGSLQKSPDDAAALVAGMEVSAARTKAAVAFAETVLHQGWWPTMVNRMPDGKAKPEAIAWLGQLDPESRKQVIANISWSWGENDPQGFAEFLRSPAGQAAGPEAMAAAARGLVRKQPLEAMELANQMPAENRQNAVVDTFSNWTRYQPEAAMEWLAELPVSDPRRESCYLSAVMQAVPFASFGGEAGALREAQQRLAKQLATNPSAAREQLRQLSMSAEDRAKVMARLGL